MIVMPEWHYHNPVDIHFGLGIIDKLPNFVSGKTILVTTLGTTKRGLSHKISKLLGDSLVALYDEVEPNPTFETVIAAYRELKQVEYDFIVAVGGGSAIDTAKAVAAIGESGSENWIVDHLKHGNQFPQPFNPKPVIAIPTTAGTGSEVTMWATVWDMEEKKKYSISHFSLYPEKAILDPELTLTLPEKETIYTGLDALSHAMEAIWNKNYNPVSDTLALKSIDLVRKHLPDLRHDLVNIDLRTHLLRASLFAGLAFSNTKTALAHSISYPLTAHFGLPHGLACSLPLPHILRFNGKKTFERIEIMAKALDTDKTSEAMASEITRLFELLGISPHLTDYGIFNSNHELISKSAVTPGRADNNILDVVESDIRALIMELF
jgi:phosphonate metabolism-associated iron-containing alcohol dehydrogenase